MPSQLANWILHVFIIYVSGGKNIKCYLFCRTRQSLLATLSKSIHTYVPGFGKTDHNVTIDILRNTDLSY